jgi:hypothetical protein
MNASSMSGSLFDALVLPSIKVKVRARSSMWTLSKPVVSRGGKTNNMHLSRPIIIIASTVATQAVMSDP